MGMKHEVQGPAARGRRGAGFQVQQYLQYRQSEAKCAVKCHFQSTKRRYGSHGVPVPYSIMTSGPFSSSFESLFIDAVLCGFPASTDLICNPTISASHQHAELSCAADMHQHMQTKCFEEEGSQSTRHSSLYVWQTYLFSPVHWP
jgi:hypothetical protein